MKNNKMFKTLIVGTLAISLVLPFGVGALENDANSTSIKDSQSKPAYTKERKKGGEKGFRQDDSKRQVEFESILEELVSDGTLTSTQVDKIKEMAEENKGKRVNFFSELIDQGTLTEEEVDAIQEKVHEKKEAEKQERMQAMLDDLIEKGTITEDDASEILDFVNEKTEERKAEFEKIKDMTEEERKAYFEENRPEKRNLTENLVEEGIITQEQADEIKELFPKHRKQSGEKKGFDGDHVQRQEKLAEVLEKIVEDGTLSQDKADKILSFINAKEDERKAEFEKTKDMTREEKKAYFEENRPQKGNLLDELVEEEIITQDEADTLSTIFPQPKDNRGFKKNK
ncbi:hypothetical protein R9X47_08630 [Wukongibacter baidiensis]|uniref:hypothetical protein n=1 Tax=Wukongibacter baidiensis TaxID=1723361 RepID=UPI003D7F6C9F